MAEHLTEQQCLKMWLNRQGPNRWSEFKRRRDDRAKRVMAKRNCDRRTARDEATRTQMEVEGIPEGALWDPNYVQPPNVEQDIYWAYSTLGDDVTEEEAPSTTAWVIRQHCFVADNKGVYTNMMKLVKDVLNFQKARKAQEKGQQITSKKDQSQINDIKRMIREAAETANQVA